MATELPNGVIIKVMVDLKDPSNRVVVADRKCRQNELTTTRVKPIIWFNTGKWRHIPNDVINSFKPFGYYLVAIPWNIRQPQLIDNKRVREDEDCHVLHCVRKEYPTPKFKGKVGPISSFAPRIDEKGIHIRGYYVGYHWNGAESIDEIPNHFSGKLTLRGRKDIEPNADISEAVRRLGIIVAKDGYCVGMEVRLSKNEEKLERKLLKQRDRQYHHTRPLITENGFYIFDGVFKWQPIYSNLRKPMAFATEIVSPLVFLGEGIHLITSTKEIIRERNGSSYKRNIQVCPSVESELVSIVDWDQFESDFLK